MHETLALTKPQPIKHLLLTGGTQRDNTQHLRLSARKKRRAMRARQQSNFAANRANRFEIAPIRSCAIVQDRIADVRLQLFFVEGDDILQTVGVLLSQLGYQFILHLSQRGRASGFIRVVDGSLKAGQDKRCHLRLQFFVNDGGSKGSLGTVDRLHQLLLHLDNILQGFLTKANGLKHQIFGKLFRASLDHHYRIAGARDGEIQLTLSHLRFRGVNHELVINIANADCPDRHIEGDIGQRHSCLRPHNAHNRGIVFLVHGKHRDDNLDIVTITFGEEGTKGTIRETAGENCMFRCPPLTFDKTARDLTRRIHTLFYINGQWEKIYALAGLIAANRGCQDDSISVAHQHCATTLLCYATGLNAHDPTTDNSFLTVNHISSDY